MHPENPGVLSYPTEIIVVPTSLTSADMATAVATMVRLAVSWAMAGLRSGPGGRLPAAWHPARSTIGTVRVMCALSRCYRPSSKARPFVTEVPMHAPDRVLPATPLADLRQATIAMVTTGGLVRKGNPDKQVSANATRYYRHSVAEFRSLSGTDWEAYHAGYFNHIVNSNPNYILPLNFLRDLEVEGSIGGVFESIYALPGVSTPVAISRGMGRSIAEDLHAGNVDGCLLVAT